MTNTEVVQAFFAALVAGDADTVERLLAPDIAWLNSGLPTVRGGAVRGILRAVPRVRATFDVEMHDIEEDGEFVRTERTDVLTWGPLSSRFFVSGTFVVRDGRIHRWDDRFSMRKVLTGFLR